MPTNLCGHFSIEVELITLQHTPVILRVPVRRCALAERMIALLAQTDEGREVASKIQLMKSSLPADEAGQTRFRAAFGPDLEAINRSECTSQRCQESCTPGFRQVLAQFGYEADADRETGEGCLELTPEPADAAM